MEGYSAGMEPGGRPMTKAWPYLNRQKQAAVEAKYFEEGATVDFDRLPGPPAMARLFGSGKGPKRTLIIISRVTTVSRSAGRPLSQAEIDIVAEQAARAVGRLTWVGPTAVVGAGVVTWLDRKRFRFPFYTPPKNGWFDPRAFPTRRSPFLSGRNVGAIWHGLRFAAYLPLAWLSAGALFTSMTYSRLMADMADPRLEGLRRDIQQHQLATGQNVRVPGMPQPARPVDPAHSEIAEAWPEQHRTGEAPSSSSAAPPAWPEAPPASSSTPQPSAPWPSRNSAKETPTPFDDTDLFDDDDDDDASPVPASVRRAERQQAAQQAQQRQQQEIQQQARQGQTAGSSWSRVRQQAGVSGSQPATDNTATGDDAPPRSRTTSAWNRVRQGRGAGTTPTGDRPGGGEDYPYGGSADDDTASKSQAQKQFDDMLEAERQGGSDGGRGGKRGW